MYSTVLYIRQDKTRYYEVRMYIKITYHVSNIKYISDTKREKEQKERKYEGRKKMKDELILSFYTTTATVTAGTCQKLEPKKKKLRKANSTTHAESEKMERNRTERKRMDASSRDRNQSGYAL